MSGAKVAASAKDPFTLNALTGSNSLPSLNFTSAASHFTRGCQLFKRDANKRNRPSWRMHNFQHGHDMNAQPESSWGLAVSCLSCKSKVNTADMSGQQTCRNTPSKEQPKHSEPPPPPKALPCPRSDVCPHRHPPHAPPCRRWCAGRASKQPCPNPGFSY